MKKGTSFEKPPINEVVFGLDINCENFQAVHQGLFWNEIKSAFPKVSSQQLIYNPQLPHTFGTLPYSRAWYESENGQRLVQLQHDRFLYNWRQLAPDQIYPNFTTLFPEFQKQVDTFTKWATKCELPLNAVINGYELTYINHLDSTAGWNGPENTHDLLTAFGYSSQVKSFQPKFESIGSQFVNPKTGADVILGIKQGVRRSDSKLILIIDISVKQKNPTLSLSDWYAQANQDINLIFESITTDKAKGIWGKK